jgi:hypothetical protein
MSEKNSNWLVKSIWLITLVPLGLAYLMAYTGFGLPDGTKNNGDLMPAGMIVPSSLISEERQWRLVVVSDKCDDLCQQQVHRLQQLYLSLPKESERLQAIWLSNDETIDNNNLTADIDFNYVHLTHDQAVFNWFNEQSLPWQDHSIWLIDPMGILVLKFPPDLSGRAMMSDIKWLLKASRLG